MYSLKRARFALKTLFGLQHPGGTSTGVVCFEKMSLNMSACVFSNKPCIMPVGKMERFEIHSVIPPALVGALPLVPGVLPGARAAVRSRSLIPNESRSDGARRLLALGQQEVFDLGLRHPDNQVALDGIDLPVDLDGLAADDHVARGLPSRTERAQTSEQRASGKPSTAPRALPEPDLPGLFSGRA